MTAAPPRRRGCCRCRRRRTIPYSVMLAGHIGRTPSAGWRLQRRDRIDIDRGHPRPRPVAGAGGGAMADRAERQLRRTAPAAQRRGTARGEVVLLDGQRRAAAFRPVRLPVRHGAVRRASRGAGMPARQTSRLPASLHPATGCRSAGDRRVRRRSVHRGARPAADPPLRDRHVGAARHDPAAARGAAAMAGADMGADRAGGRRAGR